MIKQIFSKIPRKHSKSGGSSPNGTKKRSEGNRKVGDSVHTVLSANSSLSTNGNTTLDKLYADGLVTNAPYEALPNFRVVQSSEKQNLFIRKVRMCHIVFGFSDPTKSLKEDVKRNTLLELVEYITSSNVKFNEPVMQEIIQMVSLNLFRGHSTPPREYTILETVDGEDGEPPADPAWPHLEIVYEVQLSCRL